MADVALAVSAAPAEVGSLELSIDDVFDRAARTSEDVDAARASIFRAIAERRRAWSEWMPEVTGQASYDHTIATIYDDDSDLEGTPFGQRNSYAFSMSIVENLFSGFSTRARTRAARAALTQAQVSLAQSRAQAVYDSAQAYYDALLAEELEHIARASYAQADETLRTVQLSFDSGEKSEYELLRAKVTRDTQKPTMVQRRVERDIALLRLKQLVNVPDDQPVVLTSGLDEDLPARVAERGGSAALLEADVTQDRAPVRVSKAVLEAQEAALVRARSQNFPRLDANLQYGRQAFPPARLPGWNDFSTNWTVGLSLSINLFSGFRISGDIQYAEADVYEARARVRLVEERARLDTFDAVRQLEAAHASLEAQAGTVEQAERAYEIAEMRYEQGLSTQLELADSRVQMQTAKANRARAARDVHVATVRMVLLPLLPLSAAASSALGTGTSRAATTQTPSTQNANAGVTTNTATSLTSPSSAGQGNP